MSTFLTKQLYKLARWYPLVMFLIIQGINASLFLLLTAIPVQQFEVFTAVQSKNLLFLGIMGLVIKNLLELFFLHRSCHAILKRLSLLGTPEFYMISSDLEKQAWKQIRSFERNYHKYEMFGLVMLVVIPTSSIGYYVLGLTIEQVIYLILPAAAAGLVVFLVDMMETAFLLAPIAQVMVPNHFEDQVIHEKGITIWGKFSSSIIGLLLINFLLIIPTIYHQIEKIMENPGQAGKIASESIWVIFRAGMGAIVIGILLSVSLVIFFNKPIIWIIGFFKDVQKGDLSTRIDIVSTDEFSDLYMHLNHMMENLKRMTENLEEQVNNRTYQLQRAKLELEHIALHDTLTNLPNRVLFLDRLQQVMKNAKRNNKHTYAVIFIDLNRFKVINDTLGHNVGDLMLIESAKRLTSSVRAVDTVARYGGDEFVILLDEVSSQVEYQKVMDRILEFFKPPAMLDDHEIFISISMGVVEGNPRYERPDDLLRDADIAMYNAKKNGQGGYEVFDSEMLNNAMSRLDMESSLRKALEKNEFVVHYQPIMNLETQKIVGFEALIRWNHPTNGLIPPTEFIPVAEEIGLIVPLGYWIMDEVCRQIQIWQQQYAAYPPITVSINLSTRQCYEADLVDRIEETLNKYNLEPSSLKLELTEKIIVKDIKSITGMMEKLKSLGVQVHIDNFGTGYSSLGDLHILPIDTYKIDRTFINRLDSNDDSSFFQTILKLAHDLGMMVIAEGVETSEQFAQLRSLNCEFAQGFYLAKPMDKDSINELLRKQFQG